MLFPSKIALLWTASALLVCGGCDSVEAGMIRQRRAKPLAERLDGHWRSSTGELYFDGGARIAVGPNDKFAGEAIPYVVAASDTEKRSISIVVSEKSSAQMEGMAFGLVLSSKVEYECVLSEDTLTMVCRQVAGKNPFSPRPAEETLTYVDDRRHPAPAAGR